MIAGNCSCLRSSTGNQGVVVGISEVRDVVKLRLGLECQCLFVGRNCDIIRRGCVVPSLVCRLALLFVAVVRAITNVAVTDCSGGSSGDFFFLFIVLCWL
jgi:hypothetical protein